MSFWQLIFTICFTSMFYHKIRQHSFHSVILSFVGCFNEEIPLQSITWILRKHGTYSGLPRIFSGISRNLADCSKQSIIRSCFYGDWGAKCFEIPKTCMTREEPLIVDVPLHDNVFRILLVVIMSCLVQILFLGLVKGPESHSGKRATLA